MAMGRPPKEVNPDDVYRLASLYCTVQEIADWCGVSKDTIERRFMDELERGRSMGRVSLRRKQFEMAQSGHVGMLIWLGKQTLGQYDRHAALIQDETNGYNKNKIEMSYDLLKRVIEAEVKQECHPKQSQPSLESQPPSSPSELVKALTGQESKA